MSKEIIKPPKSIDEVPLLFGISELAVILGVSKNTAREIVIKKGFPHTKIGRKYVIRKERFLEWLDQQMQQNQQ